MNLSVASHFCLALKAPVCLQHSLLITTRSLKLDLLSLFLASGLSFTAGPTSYPSSLVSKAKFLSEVFNKSPHSFLFSMLPHFFLGNSVSSTIIAIFLHEVLRQGLSTAGISS